MCVCVVHMALRVSSTGASTKPVSVVVRHLVKTKPEIRKYNRKSVHFDLAHEPRQTVNLSLIKTLLLLWFQRSSDGGCQADWGGHAGL